MNELAEKSRQDITQYDPKEAAAEIHISDAALKAAERAKEPSAFESALRHNLEAKRDFSAHYRAVFQERTNQYSAADSTVQSTPENYCRQFGFNDRTVRRWCERLLDDEGFERVLDERLTSMRKRYVDEKEAANFSSADVEWYTPREYIEAAREVLGRIDLDPASCLTANATVKAEQYFTGEDDGLNQEWWGRVFLNPPYGIRDKQSVASLFCNKAIDDYEQGNIDAAVILVNSAHAQRWQAPLYSYPVCFVDHRISFVNDEGHVNKAPTFMNIFVYLGSDNNAFAEAFSGIGYVMERLRAD